jgi:hypothetical protein
VKGRRGRLGEAEIRVEGSAHERYLLLSTDLRHLLHVHVHVSC